MPLSYFFFKDKGILLYIFYFYVNIHIIHTSLLGMWVPLIDFNKVSYADEGLDLIPYIGGDIYKMLGYPVG